MSASAEQITQLIQSFTDLQCYFGAQRGKIDATLADKMAEIDQVLGSLSCLERQFVYKGRTAETFKFAIASLPDQSVIMVDGELYRINRAIPLSNSCTADIGVAGVEPASREWHLEQWGNTSTIAGTTAAWQAVATHIDQGICLNLINDYTIDQSAVISFKHGWCITGRGSVKMADRTPVGEENAILHAQFCDQFYLSEFTVDGNRDKRTPAEASGHLILISSCHDWTAFGVTAKNGTTDGWLIRNITSSNPLTIPRGWTMLDCKGLNCFRQGMSVIASHDFKILGGEYSGTNGTAPQSGIDLECDQGDVEHAISNGLISGVKFADNAGYGLLVSGIKRPRNIKAHACTFKNNSQGPTSFWAMGGVLEDCIFDGITDAMTRGAIDIPVQSAGLIADINVIRPKFRNVTATSANHPLLYVHSGSLARVILKSPLCDEPVVAICNFAAPNCVIQGVHNIQTTQLAAIYFSGAGCTVEDVVLSDYVKAIIYIEGPRCQARRIRLSNPAVNDENGSIRFTSSATGGVIDDIDMTLDAPKPYYGIRADCAMNSMTNISFTGYARPDTAMYLAGAASTESDVYHHNVKSDGTCLFGNASARCTVATLPPPAHRTAGDVIFVTDALKPGEVAGRGTGAPAIYDGIGWVSILDGSRIAT